MYSFGQEKLNLLDISKYNVQNDEIVCFCFGEIDCRCHIYKYRKTGYKNVINDSVDEYIKAIDANVKRYKNLTTCIYNIVPPVQKENTLENPEYPYLGKDEERKEYTLYINKKLFRTV